MCGNCHSLEWEAIPSDCRATVISWIIPRHPPVPEGEEQPDLFYLTVREVAWDGSTGITLVAPWMGWG